MNFKNLEKSKKKKNAKKKLKCAKIPFSAELQLFGVFKVRKTASIRNRYNRVPPLSQCTKCESKKSK